MTPDQKFEKWLLNELRFNLEKTIVGDEQDGWTVFGRYHIMPVSHVYKIWRRNTLIGSFGSKRSALSWCIADKNKQISLCQQIQVLDAQKQLIDNDVAVSRAMSRYSKCSDFRQTVLVKLQPKLVLKNAVSAQLEKCISFAKYIQLKGFSNETARTSHA